MKFIARILLVALVILICAMLVGCTPRIHDDLEVFNRDQNEYQLTVVIDLSTSFQPHLEKDDGAFEFLQRILDEYFRTTIGSNDRVIVAQISATAQPLLFEGSPLRLRQEFPTPTAFRNYLYSKADSNGSLVNQGLAKTLEYLLDESPTTNSAHQAIFILSDMLDSLPNDLDTRQRAIRQLAEFSKRGGLVGIFFVDPNEVVSLREDLRKAGATNFFVESQIVSRPNVPNFD